MKQYTYLLVNFLAVVICFIFSFHPKIRFDKFFVPFIKSATLVLVPFIIWDAWFTKMGVWWFNDDYLIGVRLLGLPLEEWLFFICIPFSCVFTFYCLDKFFNLDWRQQTDLYFCLVIAVSCLVLAIVNRDLIYPFITFLVTALSLLYLKFMAKVSWIGKASLIYAMLLPGFFMVNGVLTGTGLDQPIVNYTTGHYMGIRIGTIPVEDAVYGYTMILWNVFFFKKFARDTFSEPALT
ncbi:lycopene cyclase domain-containing protein [Sphingobacterium pedocola]|uniref:Lycopene cyclase domain-containing protein n=1 Tax=Sphingobacterium pedocola TaxID=2082722 RepID=A0ABR9T715_9SPHI|nr:lycopene cyclase domain-containing protein [Sphingobacterium pedocola]MBE8721139.1 lycopene cyclase domain-containing protein [Sphingobacterium pedocola]